MIGDTYMKIGGRVLCNQCKVFSYSMLGIACHKCGAMACFYCDQVFHIRSEFMYHLDECAKRQPDVE